MLIPRQRSISFESSKDSVLTRPSSSTPHSSLLTPHQNQIDHLVSQFITEASDWKILASMSAGGIAYRWGKIGVMSSRLGHVTAMPLRTLSIAAGLGSEVTAFELMNRSLSGLSQNPPTPPFDKGGQEGFLNLWNWNGPNGWKESLLSDLVTFGMLKGAGHLSRETNVVFQHTFVSTAMVAGHNTAEVLGILPGRGDSGTATPLAEQFLHAEVLNIQMGAGMGLVHGLAPRLSAYERGLDLSMRSTEVGVGLVSTLLKGNHKGLPLQWLMAGPSSPPFEKGGLGGISPERKDVQKDLHLSLMTGGRESSGGETKTLQRDPLPSEDEKKELTKKFRPLFPPLSYESFSDEIIEKALATPSPLPQFHERLLQGYVLAADRGSGEQLLTAMAIEKIFSGDALRGPTGSLIHALAQLFVEKAVSDPHLSRGTQSLAILFEMMENGLSQNNLERVLDSFGYFEGLSLGRRTPSFDELSRPWDSEASLALSHYLPRDRDILLDHALEWTGQNSEKTTRLLKILKQARESNRYDPRQIDEVIAEAKKSPFGRLILDRMFSVFVVEDVPGKLSELLLDPDTEETHRRILELDRQGFSTDQIAEKINGTRHTGYLNDLRLARKTVEVMKEAAPFLEDPQMRSATRNRLEEAFKKFILSGKKLTVETLLDLYQTNPSLLTESLVSAREDKKVSIEIISGEEFDRWVRRWGKVTETRLSLFLRDDSAPIPHRILIRELPPIDLSSPQGQWKAFSELMLRIKALSHEGEHFRHFTESIDFISSLNRHDLLLSEMLALLVEFGWRVQNLDNTLGEIAERLGLGLGLHVRNVADLAYYGRVNRKLIGELRE